MPLAYSSIWQGTVAVAEYKAFNGNIDVVARGEARGRGASGIEEERQLRHRHDDDASCLPAAVQQITLQGQMPRKLKGSSPSPSKGSTSTS